jgi:hypothetical protein
MKFKKVLRYSPGAMYQPTTEERLSEINEVVYKKLAVLIGKNELGEILYLLLDFS